MEENKQQPVEAEEKNAQREARRLPAFSRILQQALLLLVLLSICFVLYSELQEEEPVNGTQFPAAENAAVASPVTIFILHNGEEYLTDARNDFEFFHLTFRENIIRGEVDVRVVDMAKAENGELVSRLQAGADDVAVSGRGEIYRCQRSGRSRYLYEICRNVRNMLNMED
jgi:hypothetical protein